VNIIKNGFREISYTVLLTTLLLRDFIKKKEQRKQVKKNRKFAETENKKLFKLFVLSRT